MEDALICMEEAEEPEICIPPIMDCCWWPPGPCCGCPDWEDEKGGGLREGTGGGGVSLLEALDWGREAGLASAAGDWAGRAWACPWPG